MKILLALLLTSSILYSQNDSVYKFTLPELKITQFENGKNVTYRFENDANLFLLTDSVLRGDPDRYKYSVRLNDIHSFSVRTGSSIFGGAKYGGFIGGGIGLVFGIMSAFAYHPKIAELALVLPGFTVAGFIGGALIGGFLGSFIPKYDSYGNFSGDMKIRKERLRRFLYKYKLR